MENRYEVLRKHFQNESSGEEEILIKKFKKNNLQEYLVLKQLWFSNADVKVKPFDSNAAWTKVFAQANPHKTKRIPIFTRIQRVAAIAIILITGALSVYLISNETSPELLIASTSQIEKANEIVLSDGSKIWLNKNSQLSYPESFEGKIRKVSLKGEAYFEIAKNPNKPFIIETEHSQVKVLGTSFNISTDSIQTAVSVATGKVNVQSAYNKSSVDLIPEYKATVSKTELTKTQITNPNYLSWKTGVFLFEDTPISTVIKDLNSYYNKAIVINTNKADMLFSAQFENSNQEDILEILKLTFNLTIHETPNFYELN